jgi:hypothetical protein
LCGGHLGASDDVERDDGKAGHSLGKCRANGRRETGKVAEGTVVM